MSARRVVAAVVIVLIGLAYLGGYWPEHRRRSALEAENDALRSQLANAESRVRVGQLLGDLLSLTDAVTALNYGQAQQLSSTFFDSVGAEAARTPVGALRTTLEAVLQNRDQVTSALARGDQAVMEPLRRTQIQLREALDIQSLAPGDEFVSGATAIWRDHGASALTLPAAAS